MKNRVAGIILFLININFCVSQNIRGTAFYISKSSSKIFKNEALNDPNMDPVMKKFIEAKMDMMLNKTYILHFDNFNSLYKEDIKVEINNNDIDGSWSPYGIEVAYFKNIKTKSYIIQEDLMGKELFVKDSLTNFDWKLESETKQIGSFLCHKATAKIIKRTEVNATSSRQTNFLTNDEKNDEYFVTAWYTEEIPINSGPTSFWGLPGLILELNNKTTSILCSKIILNSKETKKINIPKNAKIMSRNDFDILVKMKNKELENIDFTK